VHPFIASSTTPSIYRIKKKNYTPDAEPPIFFVADPAPPPVPPSPTPTLTNPGAPPPLPTAAFTGDFPAAVTTAGVPVFTTSGVPGVAVRDLGTTGADEFAREFSAEDKFVKDFVVEFVVEFVAEDEFVREFVAGDEFVREFVAEWAEEELVTEMAGVEEDSAHVRGGGREGGREGGNDGEKERGREGGRERGRERESVRL